MEKGYNEVATNVSVGCVWSWSPMSVVRDRRSSSLLCIVVTVGGAFCPWRWPSHCGSTSLSVVVAMVARCCGLCFMFVPRGCGLLSSMKDDNICVRVRSGEERAFTYPGLSFCNAKEAIPPIHHPRCCRALPPCFRSSRVRPRKREPSPSLSCFLRIIVVW